MTTITIYEYGSRKVAFEGTAEECRTWLMEKTFHMPDGRAIYRTWQEDGDTIYDVGRVYICNGLDA